MPITKADMLFEEEAECITIMEVCNKNLSARWGTVIPICGSSDSRSSVFSSDEALSRWIVDENCVPLSLRTVSEIPCKHCLQDYPWQIFIMALFVLIGVNRVVMADYFSRYPEVIKLRPTTSSGVIDAVKRVFSRHGIPETVRCDNGTQFSSGEFSRFAVPYRFKHTTTTPISPK